MKNLAPAPTPSAQPRSTSPPGRGARARWRRLGIELPDRYEPRRVIGSGGMGTVLLARDRSLDRLVAIKLLQTACNEFLRRLREEARLLARLAHPGIVQVYDLDTYAGRLYLAMEYAAGGNLALARLEPEPLVRTLRGVVDALGHAHEQGIVHRDVKPENVLLMGSTGAAETRPGRGLALLSDFGLACGKGEGSLALRRPIVGTPLTMSPEQLRGEPVEPTSDIFSFGVTLYRQLTGRWPFRGRTVSDVFDAIQHRAPSAMNDGARPVPRRLAMVVGKALEKRSEDRFQSMQELGRALDRFLVSRTFVALSRRIWRARPGRRISASDPLATRPHPEGLS